MASVESFPNTSANPNKRLDVTVSMAEKRNKKGGEINAMVDIEY